MSEASRAVSKSQTHRSYLFLCYYPTIMSPRNKMLKKLQLILIVLGLVLIFFILTVVLRDGLFSTNAIIMYSIGIIYLTIATLISFFDTLSLNSSLLDEKEMAHMIKKDIDGH